MKMDCGSRRGYDRLGIKPVPLLCLLLIASGFGCQTAVVHRGIYTVAESAEIAPLASLDMPASAHTPQNLFGPDETPVAIVIGYGGWRVDIQLVEAATQKVLMSAEHTIAYGAAGCLPLRIVRSGEYEARLVVNGTTHDSYKFSVTRRAVLPKPSPLLAP